MEHILLKTNTHDLVTLSLKNISFVDYASFGMVSMIHYSIDAVSTSRSIARFQISTSHAKKVVKIP